MTSWCLHCITETIPGPDDQGLLPLLDCDVSSQIQPSPLESSWGFCLIHQLVVRILHMVIGVSWGRGSVATVILSGLLARKSCLSRNLDYFYCSKKISIFYSTGPAHASILCVLLPSCNGWLLDLPNFVTRWTQKNSAHDGHFWLHDHWCLLISHSITSMAQ